MKDYENIRIMKEYLKGLEEQNKKPTRTAEQLILEEEFKENEELYRYQNKIKKIIAMQKEKPERVIVSLTVENLYGLDEEYLDDLVNHYTE